MGQKAFPEPSVTEPLDRYSGKFVVADLERSAKILKTANFQPQ